MRSDRHPPWLSQGTLPLIAASQEQSRRLLRSPAGLWRSPDAIQLRWSNKNQLPLRPVVCRTTQLCTILNASFHFAVNLHPECRCRMVIITPHLVKRPSLCEYPLPKCALTTSRSAHSHSRGRRDDRCDPQYRLADWKQIANLQESC